MRRGAPLLEEAAAAAGTVRPFAAAEGAVVPPAGSKRSRGCLPTPTTSLVPAPTSARRSFSFSGKLGGGASMAGGRGLYIVEGRWRGGGNGTAKIPNLPSNGVTWKILLVIILPRPENLLLIKKLLIVIFK